MPPLPTPTASVPRRALACAAALCLAATAAWGQGRPALVVVPSLSLGQTVTDSHRSETSGERGGEAITSVGAGLSVAGRSARFQGQLDYSLLGLLHARDTEANELQNRLQANLLGELVQSHLFLNALASITQQPVSALGVQTPDGSYTNRNRSEVRVLSLRPTLKGRLGSAAEASVALAVTGTDTGDAGAQAQVSDSLVGSATLAVASTGGGRLGWDLNANRTRADYRGAGRKTEDDRVVLGLSWRPDVDWQFRVRGGVESNDYRFATKENFDSWGAGVQWTPSPRTKVALDADRRAFGHSHVVALEHRSRRTVWRYTDGQDLTRGSSDTALRLVGAYDLFFELFESQEPDPVRRAELVDALLQRNGLDRDSQIVSGFLTSALTLQRRQEAAVAINGPRTTWLVSAFATRSERLDTLSSGVDDIASGKLVRQRGLSVTVGHRLTTTGALNLAATVLRSSESAGRRTELRTLSAGWSERLGPRTNFSLAVRHSDFDSDADPYTENAVIANLSLRF